MTQELIASDAWLLYAVGLAGGDGGGDPTWVPRAAGRGAVVA